MNNVVGEWIVKYKIKRTGEWKELKRQKDYWYADPILLEYDNKIYLFTEAFSERTSKGKLAISIYDSSSEEFSMPQVIINKPYHLSYPEVFESNGKVYMIPETSQNRTLELYEAEDKDLLRWKKIGVLLDKCFLADTTVLKENNRTLLYSYEEKPPKYTTKVFELDIKNRKVKLISEESSELNNRRPAGNFTFVDNIVQRPLQFNIKMYGEKIIYENIIPGKANGVSVDKEIKIDDLVKLGAIKSEEKFYKTHTINEVNDIMVVDVLRDKIDKYAFFRKYIRKGRNFLFRKIKG